MCIPPITVPLTRNANSDVLHQDEVVGESRLKNNITHEAHVGIEDQARPSRSSVQHIEELIFLRSCLRISPGLWCG